MKHIGSYDAKTKLPEILRHVSAGKSFTITNRGEPIADLVPSLEARQSRSEIAIGNIRKMKKSMLSDEKLCAYKENGRK